MRTLLGSICAALLSAALTMAVRQMARRLNIVDVPRQDRWHDRATPTMGGLAIFFAFVVCLTIFAPDLSKFYPLLAAGTLMMAVGLVDDIIQTKPYAKLIAELIAAAIIVHFGFRLPWVEYQILNDVLTIFWLVGITNALNLLDNMDGLAAGVAAIASGALVATLLLNGQPKEAIIPAILGGAALGFLSFNFSPASIFMGDCGSLFLGIMLSSSALLADRGRFRSLASVLLTPVLILMLPIFDTCMVTITRKVYGRPISKGGRDHTSHRLVALGMTERRAVLTLYAFAAASGALALAVRWLRTELIILIVPGLALTALFLGLYLGMVRVYEGRTAENTIMNALANFTYKRRILEVLLDLTLVILAYYGAHLIRWEWNLTGQGIELFRDTLPLVIAIQMASFLIGGVYRGLWRYIGAHEALVIAKSVLAGSAASAVTISFIFRGQSHAALVLYSLLLLMLMLSTRFSFRLFGALIGNGIKPDPNAKPVLIYGAGDCGQLILHQILNDPSYNYRIIGFIDDDERKVGRSLDGHRIFNAKELNQLIRAHGINEVLISSPKIPEDKLAWLRRLGLQLRKVKIQFE